MAVSEADVRSLMNPGSLRDEDDITWAVRDANILMGVWFASVDTSVLAQPIRDIIGKYIGAHFLIQSIERGGLALDRQDTAEQRYQSLGTSQRQGFGSSRYGRMAVALDPTGTLATLDAASLLSAQFQVV